jgi:hypothetical protein
VNGKIQTITNVTFHPNPIGCSLDILKCSTAVTPTNIEAQETIEKIVITLEVIERRRAVIPTIAAANPDAR